MRIRARDYRTGTLVDVVCKNGAIAALEAPAAHRADAEAGWIAPGFCDVQINGCLGHSFGASLTPEQMHTVVGACRRHGISELCPTLITASATELLDSFRSLSRACDTDGDLARAIVGFHLEGPYLSPVDGPRGAHPLAHIRDPDWDEFRRLQDAAGGRIRMVTVAPEKPGARAFIERLTATGVVVAIGHTAATAPDLRAAIAAGAKLSTHLGNGSHAVLPRHENYLWEQLAADDLWASIIVDGHHLPRSVVQSIVRCKTPSRLLLTCDASPLAGLPPGRYHQWDHDIDILPEGKIVVAGTPYLAGSWAFTDLCVRNVMAFAGLSLAEAIDLAAAQPRRVLGLPPRTLDVGQPADFILCEHSSEMPFEIRSMVIGGQMLSDSLSPRYSGGKGTG
jgi:N-acetylglucosamine-6-phosphate deacetylase